MGDSKKEEELNVAEGFPTFKLEEDEVIIPKTYSDYFNFPSDLEINS